MITALILVAIIANVSSQPLHHALTSKELINLFLVRNATEVPNYDVVPISIAKPRNRRISDSFLFQKPFGDKLRMWLNPLDGVFATKNTPFWTIKSTGNITNPYIQDWHQVIKDSKKYLHSNVLHATTLAVINNANGKHTVQGFIGDKFIKPVPSHLMDHARRHRRSVNKVLEQESDDEIYHVVYNIPKPQVNMVPIEKLLESTTTSKSEESNSAIIYPEVLVIIDHKLRNIICSKIMECFFYIVAFWNGVDMKYRNFENPKVRLHIAGIVVAEDDDVLPYMKKFQVPFRSLVRYRSQALKSQGEWLYDMNHTFPIDSYDFAVTMMPYSLCKNTEKDECLSLGVTELSGACKVDDKEHRVGKVAFVKDRGAYDGIHTAAHELGHLFGMDHDGDSGMCNSSDGYIMAPSDKDLSNNSSDWSDCSVRSMEFFLKSKKAECLYNEPISEGERVPRYLPGKLLNADGQCEMLGKGKALARNEIICSRLLCSAGSYFEKLPEAVEGTSCGDGKLCLHGRCIDEKSIK